MRIEALSPDQYVSLLPAERKAPVQKLREIIQRNLPGGFVETMSYGMIGYVVPHQIYPAGYHCNPKLPLPFLNIASQKNFIALYHMGIYTAPELYNWFVSEYYKLSTTKLDMGKSCIRFKKPDQIPFELIGELVQKISPQKWIKMYAENVKR